MTDIHMPAEALEAGARELTIECSPDEVKHCVGDCLCRKLARAAFTAMVEAWPGLSTVTRHWDGNPLLCLPLPQQEKQDG